MIKSGSFASHNYLPLAPVLFPVVIKQFSDGSHMREEVFFSVTVTGFSPFWWSQDIGSLRPRLMLWPQSGKKRNTRVCLAHFPRHRQSRVPGNGKLMSYLTFLCLWKRGIIILHKENAVAKDELLSVNMFKGLKIKMYMFITIII